MNQSCKALKTSRLWLIQNSNFLIYYCKVVPVVASVVSDWSVDALSFVFSSALSVFSSVDSASSFFSA